MKGFVDEVVVLAGASVVARHRRAYQKGAMVLDPLHYLALLEQKPGALDQAAALQGWKLPPAFAEMRPRKCAASWRRGWATAASGSSSRSCA